MTTYEAGRNDLLISYQLFIYKFINEVLNSYLTGPEARLVHLCLHYNSALLLKHLVLLSMISLAIKYSGTSR